MHNTEIYHVTLANDVVLWYRHNGATHIRPLGGKWHINSEYILSLLKQHRVVRRTQYGKLIHLVYVPIDPLLTERPLPPLTPAPAELKAGQQAMWPYEGRVWATQKFQEPVMVQDGFVTIPDWIGDNIRPGTQIVRYGPNYTVFGPKVGGQGRDHEDFTENEAAINPGSPSPYG